MASMKVTDPPSSIATSSSRPVRSGKTHPLHLLPVEEHCHDQQLAKPCNRSYYRKAEKEHGKQLPLSRKSTPRSKHQHGVDKQTLTHAGNGSDLSAVQQILEQTYHHTAALMHLARTWTAM